MKDTDDSILLSMDAQNRLLLRHLPYLVQDLREIGSSVNEIIGILRRNNITSSDMSAIDLGCGKGAISIALAKEFKCKVRGIDALDAFVKEAITYAEEEGVTELCVFQTADIRTITDVSLYDLVIYGAVGPIFGSTEETISKVSGFVRPGGFLVIDDSFCPDALSQKVYQTENELVQAYEKSGLSVIEEARTSPEMVRETNRFNSERIHFRAEQLKKIYPKEAHVFDEFIKSQEKACSELEDQLISAVWLLQKRHTERYV